MSETAEHHRLTRRFRPRRPTGSAGGRISPNGSGAPSARIIPPTATAGIISRTITPAAAPIDGAKTDCWGLPIANAGSALPWPCGTARSDSQGATFRPDRPRRESRRGRQRAIFLSRFHAHAFLHEGALQISPGRRFPIAVLSMKTTAGVAGQREFEIADTGVFDQNRYFDVFAEYAKNTPGRHSHPNHRLQSRTRCGHDSPPADPLGPQFLDLGMSARRLRSEALHRPNPVRPPSISITSLSANFASVAQQQGDQPQIALHRKRNQQRAPLQVPKACPPS